MLFEKFKTLNVWCLLTTYDLILTTIIIFKTYDIKA